ncbi:hypothetical protein AEMCBJ_29270 [Cupriavidus necator]|uniref:hypothetical protein n=1 Tax=Cupriavidus necator TaxID=106590 RepID=UPI003F739E04
MQDILILTGGGLLLAAILFPRAPAPAKKVNDAESRLQLPSPSEPATKGACLSANLPYLAERTHTLRQRQQAARRDALLPDGEVALAPSHRHIPLRVRALADALAERRGHGKANPR